MEGARERGREGARREGGGGGGGAEREKRVGGRERERERKKREGLCVRERVSVWRWRRRRAGLLHVQCGRLWQQLQSPRHLRQSGKKSRVPLSLPPRAPLVPHAGSKIRRTGSVQSAAGSAGAHTHTHTHAHTHTHIGRVQSAAGSAGDRSFYSLAHSISSN
jgi:hypothetical protein